MDPQQVVSILLVVSIVMTVLGLGLGATADDVLYVVRRPAYLGRSLLAMFVIMPLVAVALGQIFQFRPSMEIALIALSLSPVPPLLPRKLSRAGGHASFAIGLMVTVALLSIAFVPLSVALLGRVFDKPFAMPVGEVAQRVLLTTVGPLMFGVVLRRLAPGLAGKLERPVNVAAAVLLSLGVLVVLGVSLPAVWALVGEGAILAAVVFAAVGLGVGHFLGGSKPDEKVVLAFASACRHPSIAIAIGAANFPGQRFGATALLYLLVNAAVCAVYIVWQRRRALRPVALSGAASAPPGA